MKQKQIKQVANGSKSVKKPPLKKFKKDFEKSVEDHEVAQKKNWKKIVTKVQKKKVIVEEPSEDEEIDDSDEVVDEDGENIEASKEDADEEDDENEEEMEDSDANDGEEMEDSDANDGEEMEDSDKNGEEEMDDDGKPFETVIAKEEPKLQKKSKIVSVTNLPKQCQKIQLFEVFAKYGAIEQIHLQTNPFGSVANVVFKTEDAAEAALAANKTVKVNGSLISVSKKFSNKQKTTDLEAISANVNFTIKDNLPRTVYVCRLKNTTEDQIRELFVSCGEIDRLNVKYKKPFSDAFVTFKDVSSKANAKKLHNTILNGVSIGVFENFKESRGPRDPKRSLLIQNKQSFECIEAHKLENIFSKCGEIDHLDIFCGRQILAIITFKTNEAAEEAFKLSGKTVQGIELELNKHNNYKTTIFVTNLDKSVIEEELWELFSTAGEIEYIKLKPGGHAFITFKDSDSFCKSFLLNETLIKGRMIFIEPQSLHKRPKMPIKEKKQGFKRPAKNGNFSVFTKKKPKMA